MVGLVLAFVYRTVLAKLGLAWWTDENYSHGLLIPFVIGWILWSEAETLSEIAKKPSFWIGGLTILTALFLLLIGTLGAEIFTQRISFVMMIAGIVLYFWGWKIIDKLLTPFLLLILAIPIPAIIFNKIAFPLQLFATDVAIFGIRMLAIPSVKIGNVIEILPKGASQTIQLEVVEACSGIRSLMTLVSLALILAYFTKQPNSKTNIQDSSKNVFSGLWHFGQYDFWRACILMLSAVPIAILTNSMRVTGTAILAYYYGKQVSDGFLHTFSGWLIYVAALILLILVASCLNVIHKVFHKKLESVSEEV